jgi:benzoyl-CoA reductase subunit A
MSYFLGIDLGSTTTKAVLLNDKEEIVGRGLTNTRCNYTVASEIAKREALYDARLFLIKDALARALRESTFTNQVMSGLAQRFYFQQHIRQLELLAQICLEIAPGELKESVSELFARLSAKSTELFGASEADKSRFFRDIAGSAYCATADDIASETRVPFESLVAVYDKAILRVENHLGEADFAASARAACDALLKDNHVWGSTTSNFKDTNEIKASLSAAVESSTSQELQIREMVGTGYGRQRLPFEKRQIRSEILCHGLGAHFMFPDTRTVLDIGGQDTKAIQVDEHGIVTSFQMNDRCAAGCGRYLGYIADELNVGLHELGPLSLSAERRCQICSTCTVFAGAELRDLLSLGEKRENILSGLHQAIVLRAMSLLARSGGVENEFTFTGGVAKNQAVVRALAELVAENYGERTLNIDAGSIYTGALGAALYARRAIDLEEASIA